MEKSNITHREALQRYCHVIDGNTTFNRILKDGKMSYECMNSKNCEKNGGCKNEGFCHKNN